MTIRPLLLVAALAAFAGDDFNPKVAEFALSKVGEKVGDGECSTFAQKALEEAGAFVLRRPAEGGEYRWGEPVAAKDARPGDIVQFEKVVLKGRRRKIGANGAPVLMLSTVRYPHHTGIVTAVGPRGKSLTMLHQNGPGPDGKSLRIVQESTVNLSDLQPGGSIKVYRPRAAAEDDPR